MTLPQQLYQALRKRYRALSLETQVRIIFLLLALSATYLIGYLAYANGRRALLRATYDQLALTTQLKDNDLGHWLAGNRRVLEALAARPLVQSYTAVLHTSPTSAAARDASRALRQTHLLPTLRPGSFLSLSLIDAQSGVILLSTEPDWEGQSRRDNTFFIRGREETYIEFPRYDDSEEGQSMHLVTPVQNDAGRVIAVLSGHLDMAELSHILSQGNDLTATQESYLVNENRLFLTESRFGGGLAGQKAVESLGVRRCLGGRNGVAQYIDYRDERVLGAYQWLAEMDACLLTEIDQDEAFMPVSRLQQYLILAGTAVTAGVILLGGFFARSIIRPLRRLTAGVHAVSDGDLEHRIAVDTGDEIGELAAAFNQMIVRRQEAEAALHAHRDHLQEMVAARTAELEQANAELAHQIAERAEAEAERKRQWRQFLIILENFPEILYVVDPDNDEILFVNRTFAEKLEETPTGQDCRATLRTMDFPCDSPQQNGLSPVPQPYVWEHYNRAMDRYYLMSDQAIKWVDGRTVYFKLAIDITQRKLTEKALQSSEERLRTIIEQNADGILIVDEAGIVQFTNPAAEELLAQPAASLVGKPAPFSINGDDGAAELQLTSPPRVVEMRVVSTVWEDKPAQLASLRDISERRRAEERIRYQAHLLQMVSDAIISVEGEAYRIRSWNQAAEALYGWRAAEVVGKPINDVLPAHFLNDTEEEAAAYLAELGRWRGEVIHQCRDGTDLYIMASVALVTDPQSEESGMVIVAHDITGQKQLERELNAYSERLEEMVQERTAALRKAQADLVRQEKLAVLGQLAGGVAHELRNPLGAIRNAAFLLEMVLPDPDPEAVEALQILEQEVGNCNRIINSLLDFARPRPPAPVPVSMRPLLEDVLAAQALPPGVEASLTLPDGACQALVDEAQVKIALSNIVVNGVQALSQAGETAVGALTIECRIAETEEVQVIVSDTGPGVPPSLREKLFEPLYTTKAKGIGLGLALAKMLIEKNNGRIDILDNTENGAAFTIFLPRAS